jgi:hypothetical protein
MTPLAAACDILGADVAFGRNVRHSDWGLLSVKRASEDSFIGRLQNWTGTDAMMQQDRCTHGNAIGPFKDCVVATRIQSQKRIVSLQNHPSRPASNCTAVARHFLQSTHQWWSQFYCLPPTGSFKILAHTWPLPLVTM